MDVLEAGGQTNPTLDLRAHGLDREQDAPDTVDPGHHLGLGDGGAFELNDAQTHLPCDQLGQLVGFYMGPQSERISGNGHHASQIGFDPVPVQDQRRRRNFRRILQNVPGVWGHRIAGISEVRR